MPEIKTMLPNNESVDNQADGASLMVPQFKTIDGLKVRYASCDAASGDPILLLGTWPESIYAYLPMWDRLTALGPVIAVDLPGFGGSEGRPAILAPESMGDFVPHILDAFSLERPHAIGPDIGTPTLLYAAANHPGIFKSMIVGGGATDPADIGDILYELVNAPSADYYKDMTGEQFVRGAIDTMKDYSIPDFVLRDYLASYAGNRFRQSVEFVRHYPRALTRLAGLMSGIAEPCQIIVGRHDPYVPVSNAQGLHRSLRKSRLDILDCGHFAWEERAAQYGELAADWIRGGYAFA
jgi:pimeloyl-ACP methyl ester carboxylesterase